MKKLLTVLLLGINVYSYGYGNLGIGHMTPFFGTFQNELDGGTEGLFNINPYVSLNTKFRVFGSKHLFVPEFGYVLPSSSHDQADASKRSMYFILWNFAWEMFPRLNIRYGVGTFWTKISGDGGAVTTQNGTGTAQAFLPDESQTSYNSTLNLGVEMLFSPRLAGKLDIYAWQPFNSDNRRFNIALGANYYFGSGSGGGL